MEVVGRSSVTSVEEAVEEGGLQESTAPAKFSRESTREVVEGSTCRGETFRSLIEDALEDASFL